jgi:hypothetical protein
VILWSYHLGSSHGVVKVDNFIEASKDCFVVFTVIRQQNCLKSISIQTGKLIKLYMAKNFSSRDAISWLAVRTHLVQAEGLRPEVGVAAVTPSPVFISSDSSPFTY